MKKSTTLPEIDYSRYSGQWIVVCENKIIAHNKQLDKLNDQIKKCKRSPTIAKIPKKECMIFWKWQLSLDMFI